MSIGGAGGSGFAEEIPAAGVAVGSGASDFDYFEARGEAGDDFVVKHAHVAGLGFFFEAGDVVEGVEMIVAAAAEIGDDTFGEAGA